MIDHCISAFRKQQREKAYRIYVTDSLKAIVSNTARFNGGVEMTARFVDVIDGMGKESKEQTAQEVKNNIRNKLRK